LGWLPQELVTVLVVIIILAGGLYIGSLVYDMYQRSDINYDEYNWSFDSQKMESTIAKQPKHKKRESTDRTCSNDNDNSVSLDSMYKSISSSASTIEDSMSGKATEIMADVSGTTTTPSGQSKISESFMLSLMPKNYFSKNDNDNKGIKAFVPENNYGTI
jgi:hypothetical protein